MPSKDTPADLNPNYLTVLTTESVPFNIEWADALASGETVSAPEATCYDDSNGIAVNNAFSNTFGYTGTQAQYIIEGSVLQPGHTYTVVCGVSVGNTKHLQQLLYVSCPR